MIVVLRVILVVMSVSKVMEYVLYLEAKKAKGKVENIGKTQGILT